MTRFEAITPIHVGTGETVEPVCYQVEKNMAKRYSLADVASGISADKLCNPRLLEKLVNCSSKMDYYKIFMVDQLTAKPLYKLRWNISLDVHEEEINDKSGGSQVIYEQVKALDKPIIPGSSLKGAIECAFKYTLLKDNLSKVRKNLDSYLSRKGKSTPEYFFMSLVYGLSDNEIRENKYNDFLHELYSVLEVRDVSFNDLEVLYVDRFNTDPSKDTMNLGVAECIPAGADADSPDLFSIQKDKVRFLKERYTGKIFQELIEAFCNTENLLRSIQIYMKDMSKSDNGQEYKDLYEDEDYTRDCYSQINKVRKEIKKASESRDFIILRVGKYTSYFFKTVSWLFKTEFSSVYKNDFYQVFSPAPITRKNHPKPESMPKSVPLLTDDISTWPAGYLKVIL